MAFNQYGQYPQFGGFNQYQNQFQQMQKSNLDWIMVPTVSDIEKVQVQPGSKAWVMVQNDPVFALRTADQMGLVQTDIYRFEKYKAPEEKPPQANYVTQTQMQQAIADAINGLKEAIRNEPTHRNDAAEQQLKAYGGSEPPEKPERR